VNDSVSVLSGVTQPLRSTIDAVAGGTLMNKIEDEPYNLIEEMTLNNYQWSNERSQPKRVRGKLELDGISMLSLKVDAMSQRSERLHVNSISLSTPSSSCQICRFVDHSTMNYQVESSFTQEASDQVNYVNRYNPRPANVLFFNTYNHGLRNHLDLSYKSNASFMPQMNFRPRPGFQRSR